MISGKGIAAHPGNIKAAQHKAAANNNQTATALRGYHWPLHKVHPKRCKCGSTAVQSSEENIELQMRQSRAKGMPRTPLEHTLMTTRILQRPFTSPHHSHGRLSTRVARRTRSLAIACAIGKFRPHVHGTKFKVVTDHSALKWLMEIKDATGGLARWSIYLQSYDFEITERKGRAHLNVDPLSRPQEEHVLATH